MYFSFLENVQFVLAIIHGILLVVLLIFVQSYEKFCICANNKKKRGNICVFGFIFVILHGEIV